MGTPYTLTTHTNRKGVFYSTSLTIPANTPILDPLRTSLAISSGVVRRVWVRWRWGSADLCGVRMHYREFQHWPFSGSEWFPSSPYPLDFADSLPITQEPLELAIEGYNLDDTYAHTVWIAFEILREVGDPILLAILDALRGQASYG